MDKWLKFDHVEASVMEALEMLNELVDESDPDIDLPNIIHAFQTAEQIRAKHPDKEWFHLVGLIHDLGKVCTFVFTRKALLLKPSLAKMRLFCAFFKHCASVPVVCFYLVICFLAL